MRFSFYVKEDKTAKEFVEYIENQLKTMGQKVVTIEEADILVVVGGDGTFLSAARKFSAFQKPIVGINLGRLGFLTEIPKQDAIRMLKLIIEGKYKVIDRMMIDVYLNNKYLGAYLNDAVLARSYLSRLIDIEVYQQEHMIAKLRADGVIISTPTGSTAYALSAGGPILTPELQNILLVPICPHTISIRPMVLSSDALIGLKLGDKTKEAYLTLDGQEFFNITQKDNIFIKRSNTVCKTISLEHVSFFDVIRDKLGYA
ncbi:MULTISPECIES: NAD(+)/NADH kinase [unclassified Hydrogenobaculum]|uniref:NAD(+)/NADH kinase n=1 Tax=unclassified Hydrogenobaculum TaxID=2622382 RepID=UPI0001C50345|nr:MULTISPECIES: NAD(+)/NADH kinase [unclassified Hydrogenobaculum]AEF19750.1 ATP-NAD/AcoX kinase [Hydrogenobaculum sp. 3684]AEG47037.1 inorganic polyphosphate/ATP-NAD kinase [Hydrogenobaculum sp. SHO]AGG15685.1 ATP-NAD/AcoX kinase [Hydrogenobaculum sp. HO]AGH93984.1 putative sugar kinase [Hydrogenobaculum sp. SN]